MNYDICQGINKFYFENYASLRLTMPKFFTEDTEEGKALHVLTHYAEQDNLAKVISIAEHALQHFPEDTHNAFLAWQIWAYWKDGKVPNKELIGFFMELRHMIPQQAFIDFNIAALLVKDNDFNGAVKELTSCLSKDGNHEGATVLLFWIYYFSRDGKFVDLFETIKAKDWLPEALIKQVTISEAINNGTETPLYLSADTENIAKNNEELFKDLPDVIIDKAPGEANVLFVAADSEYLRQYVIPLLLSKIDLATESSTFGIHVHAYNPFGSDIDLLRQYDSRHPELKLSYSHEKSPTTINTGIHGYYASMRFCRAYQILQSAPEIKRIAITDADILIRKNPFGAKELMAGDIALTIHEPSPLWDRFAAGFSSFSTTGDGLKALEYVTNILLKNLTSQKVFWFIDQLTLFSMNRYFAKSNIHHVKLDLVFGENMQHTENAILWTYTNADKMQDNPMNREQVRLIETYKLDTEWNKLARGKYGLFMANHNDQFIGKSLLTLGSWCDHEIALLRQMIDIGDTVLEIGSNIGSHTLPLAKHVGQSGKVIAMEPQRILFQTLCASIALNSLSNVYAYNVACGEENGTLLLKELAPEEEQNFGGYKPKDSVGDIETPLRTIDSLKMTSCKLIKLDIEGMELEALKGARATLTELKPILFFESHGDEIKPIQDFLKGFGYETYDFGIPNDPMYLAVTEEHDHYSKLTQWLKTSI